MKQRTKFPDVIRLANNWAVMESKNGWTAYKMRPDSTVLSWDTFTTRDDALAHANSQIEIERAGK